MENLYVNKLASVYEIYNYDHQHKIAEIVFRDGRWVVEQGAMFPEDITETLAWQVTLMLRALNAGTLLSVGPFLAKDYVGHW